MEFNIDQLKKKIVYRSNYRGTKEMDQLLGSFTKKYIDVFTNEELKELEKLLDFDDDSLYSYYKGLNTDVNFENNRVNQLFKNFTYNAK